MQLDAFYNIGGEAMDGFIAFGGLNRKPISSMGRRWCVFNFIAWRKSNSFYNRFSFRVLCVLITMKYALGNAYSTKKFQQSA